MKMEWWVIASTYVRSKVPRRDPQKGQGLVEYSLILAFIALVVYISLKFLQPTISTSLNNVANGF
jgi:Flp pilus assembly pilin Flp